MCHHANATRALQQAVARIPPAALDAPESLRQHAQRLAAEHSFVHVVGNTWLRFGRFDVLSKHLHDSVAHYGRQFQDVFRGATPRPKWDPAHKRWVNYGSVTEAQLRLSVWATGATLLEVPLPFAGVPGSLYSALAVRQLPAAFLLRFSHVKQTQLCDCSRGAKSKMVAEIALAAVKNSSKKVLTPMVIRGGRRLSASATDAGTSLASAGPAPPLQARALAVAVATMPTSLMELNARQQRALLSLSLSAHLTLGSPSLSAAMILTTEVDDVNVAGDAAQLFAHREEQCAVRQGWRGGGARPYGL